MLTRATLRGMWAGLPVTWSPEDSFDEARYRRNVRRCCQAGAHGVYTAGTTGEFYAQTLEEWCAIARATVEESHALGVPAQVGVTDLCTRLVKRKIQMAAQFGADAVQTALPFWMPLNPAEATGFLVDIAGAAPGMPMVLYSAAYARTPIDGGLLRRALDAGAPLIGCKYTGPVTDVPALVQACPEISFLVGDTVLATGMAAGARGSCSVHVLCCPRYILRYFELCEAGQWEEAMQIERHIQAWHAGPRGYLFARGLHDPARDRVFMRAAGFLEIELECRPPYAAATPEDLAEYVRLCEQEFPEFLHDISG